MILLALNSPYLGGAERSLVYQAKELGLDEYHFLIPSLQKDDTLALTQFINEEVSNASISIVQYPKALFSLSRTSNLLSIFLSLVFLPIIILKMRSFFKIYSSVWCNGNKIALPLYYAARVFKYKGEFIWHFRDYPSKNRIFSQIWKSFGSENFLLYLVGNSFDVSRSIESIVSCPEKVMTIYNPVGLTDYSPSLIENSNTQDSKPIKHIGVASMLAPWKGIHEVIIMSKLYEKELLSLGIEKINIYGEQIYQTNGKHQNYASALQNLAKESQLINFCGIKSPQEIFETIDILVHSSCTKEPFGRVIIESFECGVPVISTGLGGAGELAIHNETALIFERSHYSMLFNHIKLLCQNEKFKDQLITGARAKGESVREQMRQGLKELKNLLNL